MKTYHLLKSFLIISTLGLLGLDALFLYDIAIIKSTAPYILAVGYSLFLITPVCLLMFFKDRVLVDRDKLQSVRDLVFYKKTETIYWKDIRKISSDSRLSMASNATMGLYSDTGTVRIAISKFPLELLRDILLNTPSNVTIALDHWLKQRLINTYGEEFVKRFELKKEIEPPLNIKILEIIRFLIKIYMGIFLAQIVMFYFLGCRIKDFSSVLFILGVPLFFSMVGLWYWRMMGGRWSWELPRK